MKFIALLFLFAVGPRTQASIPVFNQEFSISEPNGANWNRFGSNVSCHGSEALISTRNGNAEIWSLTTNQRLRVLPFVPLHQGDTAEASQFGTSVLLTPNYALVGAPAARTLPSGSFIYYYSGAVLVYDRKTGQHLRSLQPHFSEGPEDFGYSMATNGEYLVVGDPRAYPNGSSLSVGAAYVYRLSDFALVASLGPDFAFHGSSFGSAVAICHNVIAVSDTHPFTPTNASGSTSTDGNVQLFRTSNFSRITRINPPADFSSSDYYTFGSSLAFADDVLIVASAGGYKVNRYNGATGANLGSISLIGRGGTSWGLRIATNDEQLFIRESKSGQNGWLIRCFDGKGTNEVARLEPTTPYVGPPGDTYPAIDSYGGLGASISHVVAGERVYMRNPDYVNSPEGRAFSFSNPIQKPVPPIITRISTTQLRVDWTGGTLRYSTDLVNWHDENDQISPLSHNISSKRFWRIEK